MRRQAVTIAYLAAAAVEIGPVGCGIRRALHPVVNRCELEQRAARFAGDVLRVCAFLRRKPGGAKPADQLQRSSSSAVANYRAAGRARSPREFAAKMGVVNEEADETVFWFEHIRGAGFVTVAQSARL